MESFQIRKGRVPLGGEMGRHLKGWIAVSSRDNSVLSKVLVEMIDSFDSGAKLGYLGKSLRTPLSVVDPRRIVESSRTGIVSKLNFSHVVCSYEDLGAEGQLFHTIVNGSVLGLIWGLILDVHLAGVLFSCGEFVSKFFLNIDFVHFDGNSLATNNMILEISSLRGTCIGQENDVTVRE
jgi:hypothetical protein